MREQAKCREWLFPHGWGLNKLAERNLLEKVILRKISKKQKTKGNQAGCIYNLSGSLVTYQCGEAVVNGKGEMPEP